MSNCYFMLGKLDDSVRCFMVAYDIDKEDIKSCISESVTLIRDGKIDDAIRSISQAFGILIR